jgi:FkbM family methyltransferase
MTKVEAPPIENEWRNVARSINRALRPTARVTLLGQSYRLRSEARPQEIDRDYAVLRDLARDKRCILDVGANVGLISLIMASGAMADNGLVYSFEASEAACRLIRDNAALNGLASRVTVVNALIAERSGLSIDFYGDVASGGASIIPGYLAHHQPLRKATLALDDFVIESGCVPDLIKIDVEGAELRVLAGLTETMRSARPLIFIELHSWGHMTVGQTVEALLPRLASLDYCLVYLRSKTVVSDPSVLAGRGRCHVLACPHGAPILEELAGLDTEGL